MGKMYDFLNFFSRNIQRHAAGVLCELSEDKECVGLIEAAGAVHPLTDLLHSRNEGVATYAKDILYRINEDKTQEYRKRTSADMNNTYPRDDTAWPNDIGLGPDLQVSRMRYFSRNAEETISFKCFFLSIPGYAWRRSSL